MNDSKDHKAAADPSLDCDVGRGKNPCDRCGKPTRKKTDILCPDCGRAHMIMIGIDRDGCTRGRSRNIR